jgi:membrane protease YdiL (CAAX protease family)
MEEVYFRGFLLPRMNKLGKSAPLVNAALFSIYHLFSPWELISRVFGCAPFAYAVWHTKDIRISIAVHCSMNMIGCVIMLVTVFQM